MSSRAKAEAGCCGEGERAFIDPVEVCSLESEDLGERIAWIRREIAPHVIGRERLVDAVAIEFAASSGTREKVDEWIELEQECCSPIVWERLASEVAGRIRVEIRGVDPDGTLFASLPLMETRTQSRAKTRGRFGAAGRALKAGGFGSLVSFLVCCVLPLALAPLLGATALAAPLAALDDPRWMALGAVVGGGIAWVWMARRAQAPSDGRR